MKMPSGLSSSHNRQACIYQRHFGNQAVKFLYVTPKKAETFDCGEVVDGLVEIKTILTRQEKFLALGDKDVIRGIVPVMSSSFYNDAKISQDLYGI